MVRVYREQFSIELGEFDSIASRYDLDEVAAAIAGEAPRLARAIQRGAERAGDAAFFCAGRRWHCGIVIAPGRMLHTRPRSGACVEHYDGLVWSRRLAGFWRWAADA